MPAYVSAQSTRLQAWADIRNERERMRVAERMTQ
jgi:hypothetical protein